MRKFAQGKNNILKIGRDEYTDDFRRVQAESERLSDEEISRNHRTRGGGLSDRDKRALGAVYEGLLSRGLRLSPTDWIDLAGKGNTFRFAQVNGDLFHDIFEINLKYLQNGELVDLHNDYSDAKCYISSDGCIICYKDTNLKAIHNLSVTSSTKCTARLSQRTRSLVPSSVLPREKKNLAEIWKTRK